MTYLEIVNAVLRRLRETTVAAVAENDYSLLIGQFVNEAKKEIEAAWNWSHLRAAVNFNTVNGTDTYVLTGTNANTRVLDSYNVTKKTELCRYGQNAYLNRANIATAMSTSPSSYDPAGIDSATGSLKVRLYPTPNAVEAIRFYCVIPQADLDTDSDVLTIDSHPVIQLAYLLAINERGEDQGRLSEIQEKRYLTALGDAIAIDANKYDDEITWQAI